MSNVEKELLKALELKPRGKKEDEQAYLKRVREAIDELDDDGWAELSDAAQKWANDAAKLAKKNKDLPSFASDDEDGDEDAEDEKEEDVDEDEEEDAKPAKKGGKAADKKPAAKKDDKKSAAKKKSSDDEDEDGDEDEDEEEDAKPAKKSTAKKDEKKPASKKDEKSSTPRGSGVTAAIKAIMLEDPTISAEDLTAKLEKNFEKVSNMTVTTVRADFRHTLKIMHEKKALSKDLMQKMSAGD